MAARQTINNPSGWAGNLRTATEAGFVIMDDYLVIDVDPRNFKDGVDSLKQLNVDLDFDLEANSGFVTQTASGGLHLYYKKNPGIKLSNSCQSYPGVEFKQRGQQVLLPFYAGFILFFALAPLCILFVWVREICKNQKTK